MIVGIVRALPSPKSSNHALVLLLFALVSMAVVTILVSSSIILLAINSLLDYALIVSLVIAEVPIAAFISLILGERGRSLHEVEDALRMVRGLSEFQHLEVHQLRKRWNIPNSTVKKYVLNKHTMLAFKCPYYLQTLSNAEIVRRYEYEDKKQIDNYFKTNSVKAAEREPLPGELDS